MLEFYSKSIISDYTLGYKIYLFLGVKSGVLEGGKQMEKANAILGKSASGEVSKAFLFFADWEGTRYLLHHGFAQK